MACGVHLDWDDALAHNGYAVAGYEVSRDGAVIATPRYSLYQDLAVDAGAHTYVVTAITEDGFRYERPAQVDVTVGSCVSADRADDYRLRDPRISVANCSTTNVRVQRALLDTEWPSWFAYFVNGRRSGEGAVSGFGGADALRPARNQSYSFAPLYGGPSGTIGPLVDAPVVTMPSCADLPRRRNTTVRVALVRFSDFADDPFDASHIDGVLNAYPWSVRDYFERVSYGQQGLTFEVLDWITLPGSVGDYCTETEKIGDRHWGLGPSCDDERILAETMVQRGEDPATKTMFVVHGTTHIAEAGGNTLIVSAVNFTTEAIVHELGHTWDLRHAGYWWCETTWPGRHLEYPADPGCADAPYGSAVDAMAIDLRHYNAYEKYKLGYLTDANFAVARGSGEYAIGALESSTADGVKALEIPLSGEIFYIFEYRQLRDFDSNEALPSYAVSAPRFPVTQGVYVWLRQSWTRGSFQWAAEVGGMHRGIGLGYQFVITAVEDFYDPIRRIRVSLVEETPDGMARVRVAYDSD